MKRCTVCHWSVWKKLKMKRKQDKQWVSESEKERERKQRVGERRSLHAFAHRADLPESPTLQSKAGYWLCMLLSSHYIGHPFFFAEAVLPTTLSHSNSNSNSHPQGKENSHLAPLFFVRAAADENENDYLFPTLASKNTSEQVSNFNCYKVLKLNGFLLIEPCSC